MGHPFRMIPMLDAVDFPPEVEEWCMEHDYSTHYSHDIAEVYLEEESPMLTWLTERGYLFTAGDYERGLGFVAIYGT